MTSYDIGYKGTLWDNRMQLSVNAFIYDYKDLQAIYNIGPITIVDNIGQMDGEGVEAELNTLLGDNFNIRLGMSWFDSEAKNVQAFCAEGELVTGDPNTCEGNSIPWAPEWTAFAVLNAHFPVGQGEIYGRVAWTWEEDTRVGWPDKNVIYQKLEAINQTDLAVGYRADKWDVGLYVENVFDNLWYDAAYETGDPDSPYVEHAFGPSRPRTVGMRFGYKL